MHIPTFKELSPPKARFCLEIARSWQQDFNLTSGQHLLLALSGGADSTALAILSYLVKDRLGLKISACTINHGLRPEAELEVAGTKELCAALNFPCVTTNLKVPFYACKHKMGLEAAARKLRYAFLEESRLKLKANFIATAHHLDDLVEDILLRLLRGAGWPKLGGMPAFDLQRHLIRPLLKVRTQTLRDFLQDLEIPWFTDASNFDLSYKRNRLRHQLVPLLLKENPNLPHNFRNLWQLSRLDTEFWENYLQDILAKDPLELKISQDQTELSLTLKRNFLLKYLPAVRLRLYRLSLKKLYAFKALPLPEISASKLFNLDHLLVYAQGPKVLPLSQGLRAILKSPHLKFILKI